MIFISGVGRRNLVGVYSVGSHKWGSGSHYRNICVRWVVGEGVSVRWWWVRV